MNLSNFIVLKKKVGFLFLKKCENKIMSFNISFEASYVSSFFQLSKELINKEIKLTKNILNKTELVYWCFKLCEVKSNS